MKKILMIFILIALLMPGLVLAEATDQTQPITVACLGDSITFGAGVKGKENTYPAMLQVLLETILWSKTVAKTGGRFSAKEC